jgi:type I restriction enzyme M protein
LTDDDYLELLLNRKWYRAIVGEVYLLYTAESHRMSDRIDTLADRYCETLSQIVEEVAQYEVKVISHLERMGFEW